MIIVQPTVIDDVLMTASNIVEDEHLAYNPVTVYSTGDKCIHDHKIQESLADGVVGITPGTNVLKWIDEPPSTNRHAMYDNKISTVSNKAESIVLQYKISAIQNAIAFLNVDATSIQVVVTDDDEGEVYNVTESMINTGVSSMWEYFFKPVEPKYNLFLANLPPYLNATIDVTISKPGGVASLGTLVIGVQQYIGQLHYGMTSSINSYSSKNRDAEGNLVLIPRGFSDLSNYVVRIETRRRETIKRIFASVKDKFALYVGDINMPDTMVYGMYDDFNTVMNEEDYSTCNLSVEGTI